MSEKTIGLAEFISQIKWELLTADTGSEQIPLFLVDQIEIEMSVGATRSGEGGITIHVLELGGKIEAEHIQKVCVTLTPILDRETRLRMLDPELTQAKRDQILRASVKGSTKESLNDLL